MRDLFFSLLVAVSVNGCVANADTISSDEGAIKSLIKRMYAIEPDTFEFAEFGARYQNCEVVIEGKYDPERQCRLLAEFLVKEAILKNF